MSVTSAAADPPRTPATGTSAVPHRWRNLTTLTGVSVVDNTEGSLTATLFPSISAALRLDSGHLGLLAAAGKVVAVPFGPAWVWLAGRIGRRATLAATQFTAGAFGIAAGFSGGFTALVIFNTLMAGCAIGASPIANAVIADSFDDRQRARAVGLFYGVINGVASFIGPVLALFTRSADGWRLGLWAIGVICVLAGLAILLFFRDPGVGAAEQRLARLERTDRPRVSVRSVLSLFRVPTFSVMMLSRLLSGHLLITIFGIQFLVTERNFTNAVAATVLLPFGVGYITGTLGGGLAMPVIDRMMPHRGRVFYLQGAQVLFAVAAAFGTQFSYRGIATYGVFWALMGLAQGLNPPVNRPIVAAVVLPELRGQAFAIWLTIFETVAWAVFSLGAGQLADSVGIQTVFLWTLIILMLVNALVLGVLHLTYPRDVRRAAQSLERRRAAEIGQ